MKYIIFAILFFCCFKIIKSSGVDKFIWLMVGMLMINSMYSPIVLSNSHYTLSLSYLVSLFFDPQFNRDFKTYPLRSISVAICVIYLLIALFSKSLSLMPSLYRAVIDYSISFLMLFAGYHAIQKIEDYDKILNVLAPIVLVSSVYGLICFVLKTNPYNSLVGISEVGVDYNISEAVRGYRIAGFCNTSNPHAHLLTVGSFLLINRKVNKLTIAISILSLANLLLSDSRAPIADLFILILIYLLCSKNLTRNVIYIFAGILLVSFLPGIMDVINHTLNNFLDTFSDSGKNEVSGSSLALRLAQFKSALPYFMESPLFGHGFSFFSEKIGQVGTTNNGLYGMESYILWLMVEYGGVMAIAAVFFYTKLVQTILIFKSNSYYKIPLALVITLIVHILLNRPVDVYEYFLPFIGIGLKLLTFSNSSSIKKIQFSTAL